MSYHFQVLPCLSIGGILIDADVEDSRTHADLVALLHVLWQLLEHLCLERNVDTQRVSAMEPQGVHFTHMVYMRITCTNHWWQVNKANKQRKHIQL